MSRRKLIVGNWKMNVMNFDGIALARGIADKLKATGEVPLDLLVCPPYTLISSVVNELSSSPLSVGAQNCHTEEIGPHTGDISASMLKDAGCSHVIVGHSDRRSKHGETDAQILSKAKKANSSGLTTIICIGETESEHSSGNTLKVVKAQIYGSIPDSANEKNTVIAYEPVWAIGTGRTPTSEEVQKVHSFIRSEIASMIGKNTASSIRLLYGGSMNAKNSKELLSLRDVDGGLVGGASLKVHDFWSICKSCI